jgi:hypothetical protein
MELVPMLKKSVADGGACFSLIRFAHFLGLGKPFNFNQSDISVLRKKVLHALIKNKIDF